MSLSILQACDVNLKIEEAVERYSIVRSLRSVDRSDIVVLVLDAQDGVTEQDKKIAGYAYEAGKGVIIVVNKWDLVEKDDKTTLRFTEDIYDELGFLQFAADSICICID